MSMLKVSEDKTFLDTCLREACESIQRCLALLSDQTEEVKFYRIRIKSKWIWFILSAKVEQKARREDVLNQLLLLLNTAIHRKQKESRGSSARSSRRGSKKRSSSKMEIVLMQSTEEQEDEEEDKDGETNYMSGALGLIPTDW